MKLRSVAPKKRKKKKEASKVKQAGGGPSMHGGGGGGGGFGGGGGGMGGICCTAPYKLVFIKLTSAVLVLNILITTIIFRDEDKQSQAA